MTLPTFVVIGAMKAGTVSLGHYLGDHPDVFLGRGGIFGEPNFFVAEQNWPRGRRWYESLFDRADGAAAIGECSPTYTWAHVYRREDLYLAPSFRYVLDSPYPSGGRSLHLRPGGSLFAAALLRALFRWQFSTGNFRRSTSI